MKDCTGICDSLTEGTRQGTCLILVRLVNEAVASNPLRGDEMRLFEFNKKRYHISLLKTVHEQKPEVAVEIDGGQKVFIYDIPTGDESNATFWLNKKPKKSAKV